MRKATKEASPITTAGVLSPDSDGSVNGDKVMWQAGLEMTSTDGSKRGSLASEKRSSSGSLQWIMQGPFSEKRQSGEVAKDEAETVDENVTPSATSHKSSR